MSQALPKIDVISQISVTKQTYYRSRKKCKQKAFLACSISICRLKLSILKGDTSEDFWGLERRCFLIDLLGNIMKAPTRYVCCAIGWQKFKKHRLLRERLPKTLDRKQNQASPLAQSIMLLAHCFPTLLGRLQCADYPQ